MILLVTGLSQAEAAVAQKYRGQVGFLVTPRCWNAPASVLSLTHLWALDNNCFQCFDEPAYLRMLKTWQRCQPGAKFVTAPDVVAHAEATLDLFEEWGPQVRSLGFPVALVLQDGQENRPVPWADLDAVFVGGSTRWKLSDAAGALCAQARQRGKWVHMGRVNTLQRIQVAARFGCHSIDGSGFSRWKKLIGQGVDWMRQASWQARHQRELFATA